MTYDEWKTRTPEDESSDPPVTEQIDDVVCSCCGGDGITIEMNHRANEIVDAITAQTSSHSEVISQLVDAIQKSTRTIEGALYRVVEAIEARR